MGLSRAMHRAWMTVVVDQNDTLRGCMMALLLLVLLPCLVPSSGVAGIADDLIPPCCPVCRVVVFQSHPCHVSLACVFSS